MAEEKYDYATAKDATDYAAALRVKYGLPKHCANPSPYIRPADDAACNWTMEMVAVEGTMTSIVIGEAKPAGAQRVQVTRDAVTGAVLSKTPIADPVVTEEVKP